MTYIEKDDSVDFEMDELMSRFRKTDGSLDDLYQVVLKMCLDQNFQDLKTAKENEGLLYTDPRYHYLEKHVSSLDILKSLLEQYSFQDISQFHSFVDYLYNHPSFRYVENLNDLIYWCILVISMEGINSNGISEYSISYAKNLNEKIPESLETPDYQRFLIFFPRKLEQTDGETISELFSFLREIEVKNIHTIEEDVQNRFQIEFDLEDELVSDRLNKFIQTIKKYEKKLNRKVKK